MEPRTSKDIVASADLNYYEAKEKQASTPATDKYIYRSAHLETNYDSLRRKYMSLNKATESLIQASDAYYKDQSRDNATSLFKAILDAKYPSSICLTPE